MIASCRSELETRFSGFSVGQKILFALTCLERMLFWAQINDIEVDSCLSDAVVSGYKFWGWVSKTDDFVDALEKVYRALGEAEKPLSKAFEASGAPFDAKSLGKDWFRLLITQSVFATLHSLSHKDYDFNVTSSWFIDNYVETLGEEEKRWLINSAESLAEA